MIEILTTRFNDAYTYLMTENVRNQRVNNNDLIKYKSSTVLKDAEPVSRVINYLSVYAFENLDLIVLIISNYFVHVAVKWT